MHTSYSIQLYTDSTPVWSDMRELSRVNQYFFLMSACIRQYNWTMLSPYWGFLWRETNGAPFWCCFQVADETYNKHILKPLFKVIRKLLSYFQQGKCYQQHLATESVKLHFEMPKKFPLVNFELFRTDKAAWCWLFFPNGNWSCPATVWFRQKVPLHSLQEHSIKSLTDQ